MSEALRSETDRDLIGLAPETDTPSLEWQREFFDAAFDQSQIVKLRSRTVKGPWYDDFHGVMQETDEALKAIDPRLTPECLMNERYQHPQMRHLLHNLDRQDRQQIWRAKYARIKQLRDLAASRIAPTIQSQTLPEGILDTTPHAYQGENWSHNEVKSACSLAAFRMVFGAIAGWKPAEHVVASRLIGWYHSVIVEDDVLAKLLVTNTFREVSGKQVAAIDIVGADFDYIGQLVQKLKSGRPGLETYCVLTLGSRGGDGKQNHDDILHKVALLGADENGVVCHDPSPANGGERLVLDSSLAADRWAISHNHARIFVATPAVSSSNE